MTTPPPPQPVSRQGSPPHSNFLASFDIRSLVERKLNRKIISDGEKLKVLGTKMYPPDRCANRGFNIRRLESDNELQFVAYSSETDGFYCKLDLIDWDLHFNAQFKILYTLFFS